MKAAGAHVTRMILYVACVTQGIPPRWNWTRTLARNGEGTPRPRGRILDAAIACFTQFGNDKTTLNDVARVAGLSRQTIYRYFPDRAALLEEVDALEARRLLDDVERMGADAPSLEVFLARLIENRVSLHNRYRVRQHLVEQDLGLFNSMLLSRERQANRILDLVNPAAAAGPGPQMNYALISRCRKRRSGLRSTWPRSVPWCGRVRSTWTTRVRSGASSPGTYVTDWSRTNDANERKEMAIVDLELTDDQELFRETTRRALDERAPLTRVRELIGDPLGFDPAFWRQGGDLGWYAMLVPEQHGGGSVSGHGLLDAAIVAEELGRTVHPGPFHATNVVAYALAESGTAEQRENTCQPSPGATSSPRGHSQSRIGTGKRKRSGWLRSLRATGMCSMASRPTSRTPMRPI